MHSTIVYETEFGYVLLRDNEHPSSYKTVEDLLLSGNVEGKVFVNTLSLKSELASHGLDVELAPREILEDLDMRKVEILVSSGIFKSYDEALNALRERSIQKAEMEVRERSSQPDVHLSNAIQALDELDKFLNIVATRTREWYGLHFPELEGLVQDNVTFCRIVEKFGKRENINKDGLKQLGISEKKADIIIQARDSSKGGIISEEDEERIRSLASLAIAVNKEREKLSGYVEAAMERIAPNIKSVVGSTIGARLIARAGSLQRLASMPSSTIQILGAEKALFRALRTGSRPPKHGILFQHQEVHGAPKWQRGKIARAIANKVAIAARIDLYGSGLNQELATSLKKSISRIKEIYSKPKKKEKKGNGKDKNTEARRKR